MRVKGGKASKDHQSNQPQPRFPQEALQDLIAKFLPDPDSPKKLFIISSRSFFPTQVLPRNSS
jgi:hypothetical protein